MGKIMNSTNFYLAYHITTTSGKNGHQFPWERTGKNMDGVLISRAYVTPKLERELKSGTRVISHVFTFDGWTLQNVDEESQIYMYRTP